MPDSRSSTRLAAMRSSAPGQVLTLAYVCPAGHVRAPGTVEIEGARAAEHAGIPVPDRGCGQHRVVVIERRIHRHAPTSHLTLETEN